MTFRVERHKWWNSDKSKLVETGDPDAAFLAYPAGTEIPDGEARKVGLVAEVKPKPETKPAPQAKAVAKPNDK